MERFICLRNERFRMLLNSFLGREQFLLHKSDSVFNTCKWIRLTETLSILLRFFSACRLPAIIVTNLI